jgi:hypothetical protein
MEKDYGDTNNQFTLAPQKGTGVVHFLQLNWI